LRPTSVGCTWEKKNNLSKRQKWNGDDVSPSKQKKSLHEPRKVHVAVVPGSNGEKANMTSNGRQSSGERWRDRGQEKPFRKDGDVWMCQGGTPRKRAPAEKRQTAGG